MDEEKFKKLQERYVLSKRATERLESKINAIQEDGSLLAIINYNSARREKQNQGYESRIKEMLRKQKQEGGIKDGTASSASNS